MSTTNSVQKEIHEVLTSFGLSEKEITVYLELLSIGQTTLTPLSQSLNLPPTTVQSILERLNNVGIIIISKRKSRHVYEAEEPKILKEILEEKIKEISNIIPLLKSIKKDDDIKTKIRIFYRDRLTDIFNETLKSKSKLVYEIVSARNIQEILGEKYHFTKRRKENNIKLKSLRVEANEIKKYSRDTHIRELREARFLPAGIDFEGNIMFWENKVAIFSTKQEGVAVLIESLVIAKMFKQIFDLLWEISRRMETL